MQMILKMYNLLYSLDHKLHTEQLNNHYLAESKRQANYKMNARVKKSRKFAPFLSQEKNDFQFKNMCAVQCACELQ